MINHVELNASHGHFSRDVEMPSANIVFLHLDFVILMIVSVNISVVQTEPVHGMLSIFIWSVKAVVWKPRKSSTALGLFNSLFFASEAFQILILCSGAVYSSLTLSHRSLQLSFYYYERVIE